MPNHITNVVVISADDENILAHICDKISSRTDDEYLIGLDFNKIIPMPEELSVLESGSCIDTAVSHALSHLMHEDVEKYLDMKQIVYKSKYYSFRGVSTAGLSIVQIPESESDSGSIELGMKYLNNLKEYGYFTWYDWSQDNWGTKWNSYGYREFDNIPIPECAKKVMNNKKHSTIIRFNTAWDPPFPVYTKLRDMILDEVIHTNATAGFDVFYADEDFGSKVGYIHFETNMIAHYSETKKYDDMSNSAIELAADIMNTTPAKEGYRIDPNTGNYIFDEELFRSE